MYLCCVVVFSFLFEICTVFLFFKMNWTNSWIYPGRHYVELVVFGFFSFTEGNIQLSPQAGKYSHMPTHCRRQVQFQMSGCQTLVRVVSDHVFVYYYHVFVFLYLPRKMLVQNQYKCLCVFLWKVFFPHRVVRPGELSDVAAILSRIRFPISDEGFSTLFWATNILISALILSRRPWLWS